jgi:hypothetical protein
MAITPLSSADERKGTFEPIKVVRTQKDEKIASRISLSPRQLGTAQSTSRETISATPHNSSSDHQQRSMKVILRQSRWNSGTSGVEFNSYSSPLNLCQHEFVKKPRKPTLQLIARPSGRVSTRSQTSNAMVCGSDMILSGRSMTKLAAPTGDRDTPLSTNRFGLLESRHSLQSSEGSKATLGHDVISLLNALDVTQSKPLKRVSLDGARGSNFLSPKVIQLIRGKQGGNRLHEAL